MSEIDFREIPAADRTGAKGEQFEFFARDFLAALGFEAMDGPDRGQDDGRDFIVIEQVAGSLTKDRKRWLVSVKHFAHSGRAVSRKDEPDLEGRLSHFNAAGFIGFYSTLPSAPLSRRLRSLEVRATVFVFDAGRIRMALTSNPLLDRVFRTYLPKSYAAFHQPIPTTEFHLATEVGVSFPKDEWIPLNLAELLDQDERGVLRVSDQELADVVTACMLADALRRSRFGVLRRFRSFRPVVWRYLAYFIAAKKVDGKALAAEIQHATDSAYLRLLILIAGVAGASETAEAICRQVVARGRYHSKRIAAWDVPVTPFFDITKEALAALPADVLATIERFREEAKRMRRWHEKEVLDVACRQLRR